MMMLLAHQAFDTVTMQTFVLVGAAELFDKTFFITMLLAMKHSGRSLLVLAGCYGALALHVFLAAFLGFGIAQMISTRTLDFASAALYFAFALMYAQDYRNASADSLNALDEAREEIEGEADAGYGATHSNKKGLRNAMPSAFQVLSLAFTSSFLGEIGDRSQFAMIGQAASQPLLPVCAGGCLAFLMVCVVAVASGSLLSHMAVTDRTVACIGGISFSCFAVVVLWDAMHADVHAPRDVMTGSFLQSSMRK